MIAQLEANLPVADVSPADEHAHAINPSIQPPRIVVAFYEPQPRGFLSADTTPIPLPTLREPLVEDFHRVFDFRTFYHARPVALYLFEAKLRHPLAFQDNP